MTCGLCGGGASAPFLDACGRRLVKCSGCGLVRTADFDGSRASYREEYFSGKQRYIERWDEFTAMFDGLVGRIQAYKRGGRLLDVGAGVGALMTAAKRRGFEVKGVEVSEWAAAFARDEKGLDVHTGTLLNAPFAPETFNLGIVNHVLEHVEAPLELLAGMRRVLKKDGLLVAGVPNIGSLMAAIKGASWASLRPEEHIWHFTRGTLGELLRKAGFEVIRFESRENYPVSGRGLKAAARRLICLVSVLTGRSEAMLFFARKKS